MTTTRLVLLPILSFLFPANLAAAFSVRQVAAFASLRWNVNTLVACTPLMADNNSADTNKDNDDTNEDLVDKFFQRAVREVTGETDYKIGDLGDIDDNSDNNETSYKYQFGDITRSIISGMQQPQNNNETSGQFQLGDITRSIQKTYWGEKDLPIDMLEVIFAKLDRNQRINLILTGCQLSAEGLVLWGLATNLCTLMTASLSWILSLKSMSTSLVPLIPIYIEKELWRTFVSKFTGLDFVLSPIFLIARALIVLIYFRRYHSFVARLSVSSWVTSGRWKRYNSLVFNKAIAVIMAFFMANIVLSAISSALTFSLIGLVFRAFV